MPKNPISRRSFVNEAAATSLAFTIVPSHVLGRGHVPPSEKLNVACIGAGGMGASDVRGMGAIENIYALCDVDWRNAQESFNSFPRAKKYKDYREMLDKEAKNIDAVTVTIPDHSHAMATMLALKAGKHVYTQKPLTRTIWEARTVAQEAARRPKQATQMGNQGHANEGTRQIRWKQAPSGRCGASSCGPTVRSGRKGSCVRLRCITSRRHWSGISGWAQRRRAHIIPRTRPSPGAAGGTSAPAR